MSRMFKAVVSFTSRVASDASAVSRPLPEDRARKWVKAMIYADMQALSLTLHGVYSGNIVRVVTKCGGDPRMGTWSLTELCSSSTCAGHPCGLRAGHGGHHRRA